METVISMLSDLSIVVFDLALYMKLTALRKDTRLYKAIMCIGAVLIAVAYVVAAYVMEMPYGKASFLCMTIPSFLLFFCLSKYKNARFLVTFCFVDTVTLILASLGKIVLIFGGRYGGILSAVVLLTICIGTYIFLQPYYPRYRALMEQVAKGWGAMGVSTVLIYLLLVCFTAYPAPLLSRMEYLPIFLLLCVTVLAFYGVFILLLLQKAKLTRANELLKQQQHWHDLAYLDELTQLANPAAYAARTKEMEKEASAEIPCAVMIFDLDDFKHINDTRGHLFGNEVLKQTADFFRSAFPRENYEFFRIGGDEFLAISTGITPADIEEKVQWINAMVVGEELICTCSCGSAMVDFSLEHPFERAFQQADKAMYIVKNAKKETNGKSCSR